MSRTVLIGPAATLTVLRERVDAPEVETFTDEEALEALDHIVVTRPAVVIVEEHFSSTPRGRALIRRIQEDGTLSACDVRVVTRDNVLVQGAARNGNGGAAVAVAEQPRSLDPRGTRRAPRLRVREGVEVFIDGNATQLVDISTVGLQVLSATTLKPNQRVRVSMPDGSSAIRCNGAIAWASFELPKGLPPRYRAGVELTDADAAVVSRYADKHKLS